MLEASGEIHLPVRQDRGCHIDVAALVGAVVVAGIHVGKARVGLRAAAVLRGEVTGVQLVAVVAEFTAERHVERPGEQRHVERLADVQVRRRFGVVVLAGVEVGGRVADRV